MADQDQSIGWAIVEMLGHRRVAGYVQETTVAGAGFLRLDMPESETHPAQTQLIAPGSVYALHPVDEQTARTAAAAWRPVPVHRWELPAAPSRPQSPMDDGYEPDDPLGANPMIDDEQRHDDDLLLAGEVAALFKVGPEDGHTMGGCWPDSQHPYTGWPSPLPLAGCAGIPAA